MYAREYELTYIVRPDVSEEDVSTIQERTEKVITDRDGTLLKVDDWGVRKLAYDIQKFSKGHFVLLDFLGGAEAVDEAERTLRLDDKILRFLTVKLSDRVEVEARVSEMEALKLAEAETSAAAADGAAAS